MPEKRIAAVDMDAAEFREAGHRLIDTIADFIQDIRQQRVTTHHPSKNLPALLGTGDLPDEGMDTNAIVQRASSLLLEHSLFNGHPKFFGYITSSAAPIGALADLLAATVNPNVGAHVLSPMATEIEKQVIKWLASLIHLPQHYDGLLVSGGNMANLTAFFTALNVKVPELKKEGVTASNSKLRVYCSRATHTWIEKAAVLSGIGTEAIAWIDTDASIRMNTALLAETILRDKSAGLRPIMIVATAGDVSTGSVDDLEAIASICREHDCWFHVDGAYGAPAAMLPELQDVFKGLNEADSIALDPHKWLYAPLEAGCTLVKDPNHLIQTYSSHPVYYNFSNGDEPAARNFYEYGLQNSRGFRALKVWMGLLQAGRQGYMHMIKTDIELSQQMFELATAHGELEAVTQHLSITTLRYRPNGIAEPQLNKLNESLLNVLQLGGEAFLSNAVVDGKYCLRACIVNFRTDKNDIAETIDIIVREGRKLVANP